MKAKRVAVKGMLILMMVVALCLFFSGTFRTIITPKVQLVTVKNGRLTHPYVYSGQIVYTDTDDVSYQVAQPVVVGSVYVRPGDFVREGDALFSLRHSNEAEQAAKLEAAYQAALLAQLEFDLANQDDRPDDRAREYMQAYSALQTATLYEGQARLELERLLPADVALPETGYPEDAEEPVKRACDAWRDAAANKQSAQAAFKRASENYEMPEAARQYLNREQELTRNLNDASDELKAFYTERDAMRTIAAPHDGYIAAVSVRAGGSYDGRTALCSMTDADGTPVIAIDTADADRPIPEGTAVTLHTQWGEFASAVVAAGSNGPGQAYAHIAVPQEMLDQGISLYLLHSISVQITMKSAQAYSLIPVSAIHGTGADRYVYVVEESKTALGGAEMKVREFAVTVVDEADGMAAVEERMARSRLAYQEDRPLSDGVTVMEDFR